MAQRGRPRDTDSSDTRRTIIDAARAEFATKGYAAAAITAIASAADLAPSAIYHYFGGKRELYEAVFDETTESLWSEIGSPLDVGFATLRDAFARLVDDTRAYSVGRPNYSDFVAMVPVEARLHSEFAHLLDRRSKYQDDRFTALATLGIGTGELAGFTHHQATEILRALVMGWFFERHLRGREIEGSASALIALIDALANRQV